MISRPIIFIGTGRSGTTIISEIISRHRDLAFPSNYHESKPNGLWVNFMRFAFDNPIWRVYGQKRQLNRVGRFNKYLYRPSEAYGMWKFLLEEEVNFSRGFLLNEQLSESKILELRSYFRSMVKWQGRKRLVIKITGPSRIAFLSQIFPDALFIHLKRRLIPTINSFLKVKFWKSRGLHQLWWKGAYNSKELEWIGKHTDNGLLMTSFQLNKILQITEQESSAIPSRFLEVAYEDFVNDPEKELNRIIEFCGLEDFPIKKHLSQISIINRNKKDQEYFNDDELKLINQLVV